VGSPAETLIGVTIMIPLDMLNAINRAAGLLHMSRDEWARGCFAAQFPGGAAANG
jgi:hypothetical protein